MLPKKPKITLKIEKKEIFRNFLKYKIQCCIFSGLIADPNPLGFVAKNKKAFAF